jgi:hypothetical protein
MNTAVPVRLLLDHHGIEANRIVSGLYQGSAPPQGPGVAAAGFDALVLCALEYQPPARCFPGAIVLRCPLDDDLTRAVPKGGRRRVIEAGRQIAEILRRGGRVLVTCVAGRNRSGLVYRDVSSPRDGEAGARLCAPRPEGPTNT